MYKLIILFLSFFGPLVLGNGYTYAQEQTCISSDGSPNHEIGNFPTRGNPHKFKKQKIKFCFSKNPIKTNKKIYILHQLLASPSRAFQLDLELWIGMIRTLQESIAKINHRD